jgi:hypothetical protein
MLRTPWVTAAFLMVALSPTAVAQKSSGYVDLDDMSGGIGTQLAVFRVLLSETDAICPQQTGIVRIASTGRVMEILAIVRGNSPGYRMDPTADPDDFTSRRRIETDSCRIDIDMSEQQQRNGEWAPLLAFDESNDYSGDLNGKTDNPPPTSPAELDAYDRSNRARAHAGRLLQGVTATIKSGLWRGGRQDCFEAVGTYLIDRSGLTLLFPTGLGGELNRFFIERVDVDADHSTLYLSRGSCRVGFTISAAISRDGAWVPLPIAPPK